MTLSQLERFRNRNGRFCRTDFERFGVYGDEMDSDAWIYKVLTGPDLYEVLLRHAEEIYNSYPRKVAKPVAIQKIKYKLKTYGRSHLLSATRKFCELWDGCSAEEMSFCPNPSTWFKDERFNDDPSTWRRISKKRDGYGMKLMDPRWQKIRLKVFERDNWACLVCGDDKSTLAVHHQIYNSEPWTTPVEYLDTVCEKCHTYIKNISKLLRDKFPQCSFPAKVVTDIAKQSHSKDEFLFKAGVEAPKFLRA